MRLESLKKVSISSTSEEVLGFSKQNKYEARKVSISSTSEEVLGVMMTWLLWDNKLVSISSTSEEVLGSEITDNCNRPIRFH